MIRKKYKVTLASLIMSSLFLGTPCISLHAEQTGTLNTSQQDPTVKKTVTGTVKDNNGDPLIGVSVVVKNDPRNGTVTDIDGRFSISCTGNDILQISYIGFTTEEIDVNNRTSLSVILKENSKVLDDVIVIGYGTTTRRSVVGAVDQVGSSFIEDRPVSNLTQALQGASGSLNIQQRSMNPNDNQLNINIRGISTMNNNSPLIVIDGLVSDNSSLNKLNPADIESISVLKDAGTAAIYGSRSANGVLLVTTKKGKKNAPPVVRLDGMIGLQDPKVLFSPVAGYENATLKNLALTNVGANPQYTPDQIRDLGAHQGEEEWNLDRILRTALQQNYNVSVSGGSTNTTYLFSGGFYDQESNFVGPDFGIRRYNLRSNIVTEFQRLRITSILAYTRTNSKATTANNAIINSSRIPPYYYTKMQAANGKYLVNDMLTDQNPLAELEQGGYVKNDNDYFNINLGADLKIMEGLKLRGVFGADIFSDHRFTRRIQVPLYGNPDDIKPRVYVNAERNTEDFNEKTYLLNSQILLDFDRTFGQHHITGVFGATNESYTRTQNEIKMKYTDPILGTPTTGTEIVEDGSVVSLQRTRKTSINSILGRVNYAFQDKYYAEFSFRSDGSSIFAKENRWGFFPSGSVGWRISEESFMEKYRENVGDLKLRSSYGILGNQSIDPYQYLTVYEPHTNVYGFNNNAVSGAGFTFGNPDLRWEKSASFNIGFDATFLNNSLTATFDYFHKKTTDILITPVIPSVFGGGLKNYNAGEMKNEGWEVTLNYRLKTGDFNHNFGLTVGDSRNEVLKFEGYEQISTNDEISRILRVGLPFNSYYGYKTDGFFQSAAEIEASALPVGISPSDLKPGDLKFVDRNNDGVIDAKDRYVLGNAFPRYTFGFTYDVSYHGFDFNMLIEGVGKRDMMIRGELLEPFHQNYSYAIYKHQLDFWTPTNTDARWPRLTAAGSASTKNNYGMGADLNLLDGKYIRLKNIQIGYTIPKNITNKMGINKVRAFINAQNLLTLSKNSFIDPESSEYDSNMSGYSNSARNYPLLKYYGFGLNVEF